MLKLLDTMEQARSEVKRVIQDKTLTHSQTVSALAKTAENLLPYPEGTPKEFSEMFDKGIICDLAEGHAPYAPRYILPDYEKFMRQGSKFLRLEPPSDLYEALNSLLIFYRHVPSVTHFPVFMGRIDRLLEPFIQHSDEARALIRGFLIHCDRTFTSSYCHMNLGPEDTKAGRIILDLEAELQHCVPNMTFRYDPTATPDDLAELAVKSALACANPAFAFDPMYVSDFGGEDYGIASCYNGLPIGGGAFSLSRIRLNRIAEQSDSMDDFFRNRLPRAADALCRFIEAKIRFIVEETPFFRSNFLAAEGFIDISRFAGLFGIVGLCECVNHLMKLQGKPAAFGSSEDANQLGVAVMECLQQEVGRFTSAYSAVWDNHFILHAQVGAENDEGVSPGARIAIGSEMPLYDHLRQAGLFHRFFPSGVGDIFPFDTTASRNHAAILDVFKGAFKVGMRYISTYAADSDLVRVTGYLAKRSDVAAYAGGSPALNDTVAGSVESFDKRGILSRKVRSI
ncbi:MAG: YjjI family glycine radical enzyme [Clostridiales bacterium]|jgi:YjjI family glycine radical enzyme|nr:YjjI family glycine radical enzyme [Clostridiales bacterium]